MLALSEKYKNNLLCFLLVTLLLIEFAPTLYRFYWSISPIRIVGVYKVLFQIILLALIDYSNLNKKLLKFISFLLFVFIINLVLNPLLKTEFVWLFLKGSIYYLDKYMFVFLFALMIDSTKDKKLISYRLLKCIELILIANVCLMLLGYLFDITLLQSYFRSSRFGYDGIFNKPNAVSCIYIIYLSYLYYSTYVSKTMNFLKFFVIAILSLLIGTKSILLFFCLLFVLHFFFVLKNNKLIKISGLIIIVMFSLFFEKIITFLFDLFPFWDHLQEKHGVLTLLLSKRDILFYNALEYINVHWGNINYLIGGAFYSKNFAFSQMDGSDLFLFFGVLGAFIYSIIFNFVFLKNNNNILNGLIVIILICGFLGGGLLMSGTAMIFLLLVCNVLKEEDKMQK